MQYLVVEKPEDYYGGGIKPIEIHDDIESAEIAEQLYTEKEKRTRDPRYTGFFYYVIELPVVFVSEEKKNESYLVVEHYDDSYGGGIKPIEIHEDKESANCAKEIYESAQKLNSYFWNEYSVISVKRIKNPK
jgi:hypothetical protein